MHPDLPFVGNEAIVDADFFDIVLDDPASRHTLFALVRDPVSIGEYALGLHASALVRDGGTLQIGIGALSDALVQSLLVRHRENDNYQCRVARVAGRRKTHREKSAARDRSSAGFMARARWSWMASCSSPRRAF